MRNGTRLSANRAYIMPVRNRRNLHVKKHAMVARVIIEPNTNEAQGVEVLMNGRRIKIRAKKEVILSAGAFNTPQLLMLSGVGPRKPLLSLGIPVIHDLPGVGENLHDHLALGGLTFIVDKQVSLMNERIIDDPQLLVDFLAFHRGPVTVPGGVEAMAFVNTKWNNETGDYPDMELLFIGGSLVSDPTLHNCLGITKEIYDEVYRPMEHKDAFTIFPMIMRPRSTGKVLLKSRNPLKLPVIQHNYLTVDPDLDVILEGTKIAIQVAQSEAFRKFGARLHDIPLPNCRHLTFNTDDYWRCAIRTLTFTIYHQSGTAKMGPSIDTMAVVDPELRVHGIKGLRVIDASIMPFVPTAHTNGPVFMIAEKGSDFIKDTWRGM
jgi:choline dehydrogenase